MARVSYSQFSMWSSCPQQYKLQYVDKLGVYNSNVHLVFGTSMHETIQDFLEIMYGESKKQALSIDLEDQLLSNLKTNFAKEKEKMKGKDPCTRAELEEFYGDGTKILHTFVTKLKKFYPKSGYELVGIEIKLEAEIKTGVSFIGFIDVTLKDKISDKIIIIDLKTSTRGWSSYDKNNKVKTSQMLLYKKFYSDLLNVPLDKISVEYHILKRKIDENAEWPIPRISKFVPANGKPSVNKAFGAFYNFVETVFPTDSGERQTTNYPCRISKACDWCDFKTTHCPAPEFHFLRKK
jgi:hypothetical protein